MDWAKVKSIFIVLFLLFNIFLLYINLDELYMREVSTETVENTKNILLSRGVSLSENLIIPKYNKDTGTLAYEGEKYAVSNFEFNVTLDRFPPKEKSINKILISAMETSGIISSKFVLDQNGYVFDEETETLYLTFVEKWQGCYVFDNRINIALSKDGSGVADITYRKIKRNNKENEILSVCQVLISNSIEEGTKIMDIALGFAQEAEGDIYASPVWRIRNEMGQELYFSAYDGTQVK